MHPSIGPKRATIALALTAVALLSKGCKDDPTAVTPQNSTPVYWMPYGQALERARRENKPVMVFFYTQWCGWSRRMDQDTFGDSSVVQYVRANFVATHIDAESWEEIAVGDRTTTGFQLARDFGVNAYPVNWFLSANGDRLNDLTGYIAPARFLEALVYIHGLPEP
jgi:thioredoxin-related protein